MTKLMLTTSTSGDVIIAEVPKKQPKEDNAYYVSMDFVKANVRSGAFVDMTGKIDYDYRIWVMQEEE